MAPSSRRGCILLAVAALVGPATGASLEVVDLDEGTFDSTVGASEHWLVAFTAPWCGHCKKLKEPWAAAAISLGGKVRFGVVDATRQKALAQRFDVKGYPTIKYLHEGRVRNYRGSRALKGLEAYGERIIAPPVGRATSVAEVREALGTTGRAFVIAHTGSKDAEAHPLVPAFAAVAAELHDELEFYEITERSSAVVRELLALGGDGAAADEAVVAVLDGERWGKAMPFPPTAIDAEPSDTGSSDPTTRALKNWTQAHAQPRVLAAGGHNIYDLKRCGRRVALGVLDAKAEETARAQRAQLAAHADAFDSDFRFAWIDGTERAEYWEHQFGLMAAALPTVLVLEARTSDKDEERHWVALNGTAPLERADEQAAFLRAIAAGELPSTKSGDGGGVLSELMHVVRMLKAFALDNPAYFFGCCALNVVFLALMCATSPGAAVDPSASAARAVRTQAKSAKAE